jgi:hypothetical protein
MSKCIFDLLNLASCVIKALVLLKYSFIPPIKNARIKYLCFQSHHYFSFYFFFAEFLAVDIRLLVEKRVKEYWLLVYIGKGSQEIGRHACTQMIISKALVEIRIGMKINVSWCKGGIGKKRESAGRRRAIIGQPGYVYYKEPVLPLTSDPPVRLHDDRKGGTTMKIAI